MTQQPQPSTPTPRRFLLSKRPPQSQQQKTPGSGTPVFVNSQRFHATPRFAPPSSAQRPPSTPLFPGTLRPSRAVEPIQDALDSSPPEAPPTVTRSARPTLGASTQRVKERIEIDSDAGSDLQEDEELPGPSTIGYGVNDSIEIDSQDSGESQDDDLRERTPKRRRISISPAHSWHEELGRPIDENPQAKDSEVAEDEDQVLPDAEREGYSGAEDLETDQDFGLPNPDGDTAKTQPVFHRAPRFKVSESETSGAQGLPLAFSPQRRGPKYIPGGLASELQSWLAQVKGWGGGDRPPDLVMRIVIDEVRPGTRMYLVSGRRIVGDGSAREEIAARLMLAGEGKLTGLGQKAPVVVGSTVSITQPAWEIVLEGTRWIVACDWSVREEASGQ